MHPASKAHNVPLNSVSSAQSAEAHRPKHVRWQRSLKTLYRLLHLPLRWRSCVLSLKLLDIAIQGLVCAETRAYGSFEVNSETGKLWAVCFFAECSVPYPNKAISAPLGTRRAGLFGQTQIPTSLIVFFYFFFIVFFFFLCMGFIARLIPSRVNAMPERKRGTDRDGKREKEKEKEREQDRDRRKINGLRR